MGDCLRLLDRDGFVVVPAADLTLLHSVDRLIHIYTRGGLAGCVTRPPLHTLVERVPADWIWISRAAVVRRSAILRVDWCRRAGHTHRRTMRVAGVHAPVQIAIRQWAAVRQALGA